MKGTKPQLRETNDAVTTTPPAPTWLSAEGKKEWRRVAPILVRRRVLTTADLGSLESYCLALGRSREIERLLRKGFDAPLFRAQDKAMATSRLLAAELGLTPVSRSRPAIRDDTEADDGQNPLDVS